MLCCRNSAAILSPEIYRYSWTETTCLVICWCFELAWLRRFTDVWGFVDCWKWSQERKVFISYRREWTLRDFRKLRAVSSRVRRSFSVEAKISRKEFRFDFFACFASKRNTGNHKRNENELNEKRYAKQTNNRKFAKEDAQYVVGTLWNKLRKHLKLN
jgi:hypothetical protein